VKGGKDLNAMIFIVLSKISIPKRKAKLSANMLQNVNILIRFFLFDHFYWCSINDPSVILNSMPITIESLFKALAISFQ